MTGREAFEAWAREVWGFPAEEAWLAWQAACRACADACDSVTSDDRQGEYVRDDCADACRALGDEG